MDAGSGGRLTAGMDRLSQSPVFRGRLFLILLVVNVLFALVSGLILVWVGIERMDSNYFINLERSRFREKMELNVKLHVERERLLSPYELRARAQKYGMKQPAPGQIRRLDVGRPAPPARRP